MRTDLQIAETKKLRKLGDNIVNRLIKEVSKDLPQKSMESDDEIELEDLLRIIDTYNSDDIENEKKDDVLEKDLLDILE